jgi:hypothetical protein
MYLIWISFLLLLTAFPVSAQNSYPLLLSGGERASWNFTLERGQMMITGICLTRQTEDGVKGAVVNEFGIHYFDFVCHNNKVKVNNVFPHMNKWYIRRVLRNDLRLLTANSALKPGRRLLKACQPDSLSLQNIKYGITYRFERLQ